MTKASSPFGCIVLRLHSFFRGIGNCDSNPLNVIFKSPNHSVIGMLNFNNCSGKLITSFFITNYVKSLKSIKNFVMLPFTFCGP